MSNYVLTPEDLLAGAETTFEIDIPKNLLRPRSNGSAEKEEADAPILVIIRPITLGAFQLILKAANEDYSLIPLLMIKESLVQPQLNLNQIKGLHIGLVGFLIEQIHMVSGMNEKKKI